MKEINPFGIANTLLDFIYSACAIIHHVNMMRCFQVIVLIYSSIYIQNRMAHWHSKNNISLIRRCCDLHFGRFLMEHLLYYMLSTMCCIYWSRRYISGLMMNILIMQTIRPIIAFYFIFLFMLIRHSSSNKMNTQGHPDLFFDSD